MNAYFIRPVSYLYELLPCFDRRRTYVAIILCSLCNIFDEFVVQCTQFLKTVFRSIAVVFVIVVYPLLISYQCCRSLFIQGVIHLRDMVRSVLRGLGT